MVVGDRPGAGQVVVMVKVELEVRASFPTFLRLSPRLLFFGFLFPSAKSL